MNKYVVTFLVSILSNSSFAGPIQKAVNSNDIEEARRVLQENKTQVNLVDKHQNSLLNMACINGNLEMVNLLLEFGADPNLSVSGSSPLLNAIVSENPQIVELLITQGALVDGNEEDHNPPLHAAIRRGNFAIVKILLENGANANGVDRQGVTALNRVPHWDNATEKLLVEYGAEHVKWIL